MAFYSDFKDFASVGSQAKKIIIYISYICVTVLPLPYRFSDFRFSDLQNKMSIVQMFYLVHYKKTEKINQA
jgi:hypothetical protein